MIMDWMITVIEGYVPSGINPVGSDLSITCIKQVLIHQNYFLLIIGMNHDDEAWVWFGPVARTFIHMSQIHNDVCHGNLSTDSSYTLEGKN